MNINKRVVTPTRMKTLNQTMMIMIAKIKVDHRVDTKKTMIMKTTAVARDNTMMKTQTTCNQVEDTAEVASSLAVVLEEIVECKVVLKMAVADLVAIVATDHKVEEALPTVPAEWAEAIMETAE